MLNQTDIYWANFKGNKQNLEEWGQRAIECHMSQGHYDVMMQRPHNVQMLDYGQIMTPHPIWIFGVKIIINNDLPENTLRFLTEIKGPE